MKIREILKCANFTLSGKITVYDDFYNYIHSVDPIHSIPYENMTDEIGEMEIKLFHLTELRYEYFHEVKILLKD